MTVRTAEQRAKWAAYMRSYHARNPQKNRDRSTRYRLTHLEDQKRRKAKYYAANRQREIDRSREDRLKDPAKAAAYKRAWNARNKAYWQQLRAMKRGASGHSNADQIKARWDYYGGLCWMCRRVATVLDHVKPLIAGGSHWPSNLRPACRSCNSRKQGKWPLPPKENT